MTSLLSLGLLSTAAARLNAQSPNDVVGTEWRGWVFGRVGPAYTSEDKRAVLGEISGGAAVSRGMLLAMFRAADNHDWTFSDSPKPGVRDYSMLAGLRSRGDRLFFSGTAGFAYSQPIGLLNTDGTLRSGGGLSPAFDLAAHSDYRVAGIALTASGVVGLRTARYLALSIGVELGWFGR